MEWNLHETVAHLCGLTGAGLESIKCAENVLPSMFNDEEPDDMASGWEILIKEKKVRYLREAAAQTSVEEWTGLLPEAEMKYPEEAWREKYTQRTGAYRYVHLYYLLKKSES